MADGIAIRIVSAFNEDRKSTRLNSSHGYISYAVFCLKKKKTDLVIVQGVPDINFKSRLGAYHYVIALIAGELLRATVLLNGHYLIVDLCLPHHLHIHC